MLLSKGLQIMKNLVIAHGGGPTSVINASLAGAIKELKNKNFKGKILAPRFGSAGLLNEDFIDLTNVSDKDIELLIHTPGSAIGTSRFPLYDKEYEKIIDILIKNDIGYVLFTGGNGSMDTIGNIYKHALKRNYEIICGGIPKTVDNDIALTDHAPGFISCAKFIMQSVSDCAQDIKGLPIHVSIIEVMGRNAGWLAASSALAKINEDDAPHIILFPEIPFDEEKFLKLVKEKHEKYKGVIVVASEGLVDKNGNPIVKPIYKTERATYFGDVASYLQTLVISKLGIKARSEKPGLLCRCSSSLVSELDLEEAQLMGKISVDTVLAGKNGYMVGIKRISSFPYKIEPILIPINEVMLNESKFPEHFMSSDKYNVSKEFIEWLRPLVGYPNKVISFVDKSN
mgnify:CR=1 FL=1